MCYGYRRQESLTKLSAGSLADTEEDQLDQEKTGSTSTVQPVYDLYDYIKRTVSDNRPASEIVPTCVSGMIWITLPFEVSVASPTLSGCAKPLANDTNTAAQQYKRHVNADFVRFRATNNAQMRPGCDSDCLNGMALLYLADSIHWMADGKVTATRSSNTTLTL